MKKIIIIIFHFTLALQISQSQNLSDSTDYYLKACGYGFRSDTIRMKSLSINNSKINKEAVNFVVSKMIDAHGGMDNWNKASVLSFTHILVFGKPLDTEFWVSHETTEINSGRTYHDWPILDSRLAYDGTRIWTENWAIANPPGTNVNNIYYAVAMPWLSQKSSVILEAEPVGTLPGDSLYYFVIKMTYTEESKESPHKYYKLFVHPMTYLLTGLEFNITYAPFLDMIGLPVEQKSLGPYLHVFYSYTTVDELVFPQKYDTFDKEGHNSGRHIVYDYSLNGKFDESRMVVLPDAKIDSSKSIR